MREGVRVSGGLMVGLIGDRPWAGCGSVVGWIGHGPVGVGDVVGLRPGKKEREGWSGSVKKKEGL